MLSQNDFAAVMLGKMTLAEAEEIARLRSQREAEIDDDADRDGYALTRMRRQHVKIKPVKDAA